MRAIIGSGSHPVSLVANVDESFPPSRVGAVSWWSRPEGAAPEFVFELWAPGACRLERVTLFSAVPHPISQAPIELMTDGDKLVSSEPHKLKAGDGPFFIGKSGARPFWVRVMNERAIQLQSTLDATIGGDEFVTTDEMQRDGGIVLVATAQTSRLWWSPMHTLSNVELGPQLGATAILRHTPRVVAYALTVTPASTAMADAMTKTPKAKPLPPIHASIWAIQERG